MILKSKTTPWAHQAKELELWESESRALLWQMRTGKTKVIIDTLGGWFEHKGLRSAIIVAPNGVHDNWVRREFPKHADYQHTAFAWHSSKAGTKKHRNTFNDALQKKEPLIFAVGKEAILSERAFDAIKLILKRGPCALIADESHHFGEPGAKRTRRIRGLAQKCDMRRILTGTPTGNSPLKLFSQFEILEKEALGYRTYGSFERRYAVTAKRKNKFSGRQYPQVVGYQNVTELRSLIQPYSSVVLREDCEDLPPLISVRQYYEMTKTQRDAYEQMRLNLVAELETGERIDAFDAGVKLIRLQQILSNFSMTEDFELATIDKGADPRLDALVEVIDGPTIVWCRFREDIRRVVARLTGEGLSCVEYHGTVPRKARQQALDRFMDGSVGVFVGQPACAGEGLDLSRAETIVWYSHVFDVVSRDQASERATKVGGKSISVVDLAVAGSVDEYILDNLDQKHSIADRLTGTELRDILAKCEV